MPTFPSAELALWWYFTTPARYSPAGWSRGFTAWHSYNTYNELHTFLQIAKALSVVRGEGFHNLKKYFNERPHLNPSNLRLPRRLKPAVVRVEKMLRLQHLIPPNTG